MKQQTQEQAKDQRTPERRRLDALTEEERLDRAAALIDRMLAEHAAKKQQEQQNQPASL